MKIYQYNVMRETFPYGKIENTVLTYTENDIIEMYFPYWSAKMQRIGRFDKISIKNCIDDWVIGNYAWEIKS